MKANNFVLCLVLFLIGLHTVSAAVTTCNSCSDCTGKLNGDYGTVTLANDIVDFSGGHCIEFGAADITFDCDNHEIAGTHSAWWASAIVIQQHNGLTIKNCVISDFYHAVYMTGYPSLRHITLSDNKIYSSMGAGIWMSRASESNIINNIIKENSVGIWLTHVDYSDNVLEGNSIYQNGWAGIYLDFAEHEIIRDNIISSNDYGIYLSDSSYNEISGNRVYDNRVYDFYLKGSSTGNYGSENTCDEPDGWDDDGVDGCTYSTAGKPDLSLDENDISFSPEEPAEGETVTITATIHNIGEGNAENVLVRFYDGDPITGIQINGDQTIATIPAGENRIASVEWTATQGTHEIYVVVDPDDTISEEDEENNIGSAPIIVTGKSDFTILDIRPVQVIYDSDINDDDKIDMVLGKSSVALVYVGMEDYEAVGEGELIYVRLTYEGSDYIKSKTVEQLEEDNHLKFYFTPTVTGDKTITVKADPNDEIEESDEANNEMSVEVTVKDTESFHVGYIKVIPMPPASYSAPDEEEFSRTADESGIYLKATYPVAGDEFINEERSEEYIGDPIPIVGLFDDLISLAFWKWILGIDDRVVGIVSDDYFSYHSFGNAGGVSNVLVTRDAVLAKEGWWFAAAHEIGHTYNLRLPPALFGPGEEYNTNPPGNPASGFWVDGGEFIDDAICIMGTGEGGYHMGVGEPRGFLFDGTFYNYDDGTWVDDDDYEDLFREFRSGGEDPEILLVGGILYKNGTIELKNIYWIENRTIEEPIPGNYSIQFLDREDEIIDAVSFGVSFELNVEPYGIIETNVSGFAFPVYYPKNTSKILLQYNAETIMEIDPNVKLLRDAINSIPEHGFVKNPEQRRNALHNKIDAVEGMIEKGNYVGAENKLEQDIRDKLEKWLADGYLKEDPLQLSKEEIIELVDEIIHRFNLM